MDFIVVGGGCYGSFYTRQLLRGGGRIGLGKIHVIDRDPECRVAREFGSSPEVVFHIQDWKEFLAPCLDQAVARRERGEEVTDQYVPPCLAPHILFELFLEKAKREFSEVAFSTRPFGEPVGTPFDIALPAGTRALSFATWECPHSCIEPPTCPHTRGPKDWDMKEYLIRHSLPLPINSIHFFQCRHLAMGVGTIPMQAIL